MSSADISIFHQKSATFVIPRNYRYRIRLCFNTQLLILLTLLESLKVVLINMVVILMMPSKLATLGFLKIKIF